MMTKKVLLAVLAHPDDETFGTGGTLALYARAGAEVYLICATRGEVGEMDPKLMRGFNSIAERREHELRCASEVLGLSGVFFLDYRDSGMPGAPDNHHPRALAAQPVEQVAENVERFIRRLQPQVVITFDPIGGYRHPDHIAIHQATVKAFHSVREKPEVDGYCPQRLYFQSIPRVFLRLIVRVLPLIGRDPRKFGQNKDIDLVSIAEVHFPTHVEINYREVAEIRDAASRCHESQGGASLTSSNWIGRLRRWFFSKEMYMRAYPPAVDGEKKATDLYIGL
jgi:LmbE family N-acetylglucosaminyl deacetylase